MNAQAVVVSISALQSLEDIQRNCSAVSDKVGAFIGRRGDHEGTVEIWSCTVSREFTSVSLGDALREARNTLPGGLYVVGFWEWHVSMNDYSETSPFLSDLLDNELLLFNPIVIAIREEPLSASGKDSNLEKLWSWKSCDVRSQSSLCEMKCDVMNCVPRENFLSAQLQFNITLNIPFCNGFDEFLLSLNVALKNWKECNFSKLNRVFVAQCKSRIVISDDDDWTIPTNLKNLTVAELFSKIDEINSSDELRTRKKRMLDWQKNQFIFRLATRVSGADLVEQVHNVVPVLRCAKENSVLKLQIPIRAFVIAHEQYELTHLVTLLHESAERQFENALHCLKVNSTYPKAIKVPVPFVFVPERLHHPVVICHPRGVELASFGMNALLTAISVKIFAPVPAWHLVHFESLLRTEENYRLSYHQLWNLPCDRPQLRKTNRFLFPFEYGPYLRNVHECGSLPQGFEVACVLGNYDYHHYMQDGMNDNGLQGYTDVPVPDHKQIQQALVDCGDRPKSFVGSRQWIGSLELSYCLNQMLDVTSKIMAVNSGSELELKARELLHHFRTTGTPVMIGGGVLAHTILGVAFNASSGQAQFLILDPHYTDEENAKKIISKGWCGWKPVTFWESNSFYNLLLPQRPNCI